MNGYVKRFIGTIRRECLDHMIVFGEDHLKTVPNEYADYYNTSQTHLSLDGDRPEPRECNQQAVSTLYLGWVGSITGTGETPDKREMNPSKTSAPIDVPVL